MCRQALVGKHASESGKGYRGRSGRASIENPAAPCESPMNRPPMPSTLFGRSLRSMIVGRRAPAFYCHRSSIFRGDRIDNSIDSLGLAQSCALMATTQGVDAIGQILPQILPQRMDGLFDGRLPPKALLPIAERRGDGLVEPVMPFPLRASSRICRSRRSSKRGPCKGRKIEPRRAMIPAFASMPMLPCKATASRRDYSPALSRIEHRSAKGRGGYRD